MAVPTMQFTCRGCNRISEDSHDLWQCSYCASGVCWACYHDHTDSVHFASLYPDIAEKLKKEAQDAEGVPGM